MKNHFLRCFSLVMLIFCIGGKKYSSGSTTTTITNNPTSYVTTGHGQSVLSPKKGKIKPALFHEQFLFSPAMES